MHFSQILGHREVKERLGKLAVSGRLGHAYLFLGPEGVGRRALAVGWTQVLNCTAPLDGYPFACGQCQSCRKIAGGQFPDLFMIAPEEGKNLKVEAIREMLRETHYKPYEGKRRVFVLDDADMMNDAAANALLKTLEEPSETMLLILIAEHEGQVLPTIRSRCQIVRIGSLAPDVISSTLVAQGVSETDARWLANEAAGSLGRAHEALALQEETGALRDDLFAALDQLAERPLVAFRVAEKYKNAQLAPRILHLLRTFYRDAVLMRTGHGERIVNVDFDGLVRRYAERTELPDLVDAFQAVEKAGRMMEDFNANKQLVLERLLQELAALG